MKLNKNDLKLNYWKYTIVLREVALKTSSSQLKMAQCLDNHTLYIESGVAREDQVMESLKQAISNVERDLGQTFPCSFKINLIRTKEVAYFGSGYIRVSNPEVYWMLVGCNPDGSSRVEEYPDPNWVAPVRSAEKSTTTSWADMVESEELQKPPIIRVEKEPLMELPGYPYDEQQLKHLRTCAVEDGEDPDTVPTHGYFIITRAHVNPIPQDKLGYVLCSRRVPNWVDIKSAFKSIFGPYVTDPKLVLEVKQYDTVTVDTAPVITSIVDKKKQPSDPTTHTVFVIFDPQVRDASFARVMQRKTRLVHPKDPSLRCEIIFDYAYASNRVQVRPSTGGKNRRNSGPNHNKRPNQTHVKRTPPSKNKK